MNDKRSPEVSTGPGAHGAGRAKWLIAAAAAAVLLLGGGYWAWRTYTPGRGELYVAATDTYAEDALRVSPQEPVQPAPSLAIEENAATPPLSAARAPARRATARAQAIPVETIGVTPESAAIEDDQEIVVTAPRRPVWVRTPSARRLAGLYPARALERGREGEATLQCTVRTGGALDCMRMEETPGGFGVAALRVARTLRHAPQLRDGSDAIGTPVNLRVVFRMKEEERRG